MKHRLLKASLPIAIALIVTTSYFVGAGDLNPPAGLVAGTMKTLTEVEPRTAINATNTPGGADSLFKITLPGSYYLTGNIQGVAAMHGIEIAASGVTLDLNGFDLVGIAGSLDGVSVTITNRQNIAVVNGSVRSWGGDGVDLGTFFAFNCRVAEVLASGNTGNGIKAGTGCTVSNCSAYDNTGTGISTSDGCTVTNCSAYGNRGNLANGISVGGSCTVADCSAVFNNASGIAIGNGSAVTDCTTRINTLDGILCPSACLIRGNSCFGDGNAGDGAGIHATSNDNRIEGNNCTAADRGIDVDAAGNFITRNTCSGNTTNNWDVVASNVILVVNATLAGAVTGNSGGTAPGSTDPNANFSY